MYSPKISEDLVPVLYRMAKERKTPMTRLVDGIIRDVIALSMKPERKAEAYKPELSCQETAPRNAVA